VHHKLADINSFHDERLGWPQDVLSQSDVQVAGLMTRLWRGYSCRVQMTITYVMDRKVPDEEEKKNPTKRKIFGLP